MRMEAYKENLLAQYEFAGYQAWLNGLYNARSIGACFDKMKYPDNPLKKKSKETGQSVKGTGKSETQLQQELLYMQMRVMQANFELNKSDNCTEK